MPADFDLRDPGLRKRKDQGLGAILAELNQRFMPAELRGATGSPSRAQTRAYGAKTLAPKGDRAYSAYRRTNTGKGERGGQEFRTFVKRDQNGDIYRYHEYNVGGKRRVVRVGKALH